MTDDETEFLVKVNGGPRGAAMLAAALREEGAEVSVEEGQQQEARNAYGVIVSDANAAAVVLLARGAEAVIRRGVERFRAKHPQARVGYKPRHRDDDG